MIRIFPEVIKDYYNLCKPGIVGGNLISATGGFFLASAGRFDALLFIAALVGVALIVASGCIVNNYYDRDIDALMPRTKKRLLVHQTIHPAIIASFSALLGISGFILLIVACNWLTALLGLLGFIVYVIFYTLWLKRRSPVSTIVGSISGALPPVMGYCAVTASWDIGASCLFLLFCLWQMPHHYAISIYRLQDYQSANIPVLPAVKGIKVTFYQITGYIVAFWVASSLLTLTGYTGFFYLFGTAFINAWWLKTALRKTNNDKRKARKLFLQSIVVITFHSLLMSINSLPK